MWIAVFGISDMTAFTRKMLASRAMRFLCPKLARKFIRRNDGSAAVEFGMVAAPFLALIFAILETALVFFAGQTLETAAADSARLIMTGQAQTKGFDQGAFKSEVCKRIFALFDCAANMKVDVRTYTAFTDIDLTKPIGADGKLKDDLKKVQQTDAMILTQIWDFSGDCQVSGEKKSHRPLKVTCV
jgi:Flp pilus assembly protein TadG